MNLDRELIKQQLLRQIQEEIITDPSFIERVIHSITKATTEAIKIAQEKSADMEMLAAIGFGIAADKKRVSKQTKTLFEETALAKLTKHFPNTNMEWSHLVQEKTINK